MLATVWFEVFLFVGLGINWELVSFVLVVYVDPLHHSFLFSFISLLLCTIIIIIIASRCVNGDINSVSGVILILILLACMYMVPCCLMK